jgi:hypothetical protein
VSESERAAVCADAETFSCNTRNVLSDQFVKWPMYVALYKSKYFSRSCQCSIKGGGGGGDDDDYYYSYDTYPRK